MQYSIGKPTEHRPGKWRCLVRIGATGDRRWAPLAESAEEARGAAEIAAQAWLVGQLTVGDAIEQYQARQLERGNRTRTIESSGQVLRRFFAPLVDRPLITLTPAAAAGMYEQLRQQPGHHGKALAVDSHRNYMLQARSLLAWCVEQKWLKANPLAGVKGVGRRRHGKAQPRIDEARRLRDACMELAHKDDGALVVMMAMTMAMRAGEMVTRTVRDLDDGGRVLWVEDNEALGFETKTEAGRRPVKVPTELQPLLIERTRSKLPAALLFPGRRGAPHWRDWPNEQAQRMCKLAGIPPVCAHALRGFVATAAMQAGAAPELVAQLLGHEDKSTTLRSYAEPGSNQAQVSERGMAVLRGHEV